MKITDYTLSNVLTSNRLELLQYVQIKSKKIFEIETTIYKSHNTYCLACKSADYATVVLFTQFFCDQFTINPNELIWITPKGRKQSLDTENRYESTCTCKNLYEYPMSTGCIGTKTVFKNGGWAWRYEIIPERCNSNTYIDVLYNHDWDIKPKLLSKTYDYLKNKLGLDFICNHKDKTIQIRSKDYYEFITKLKDLPLLSIPTGTQLVLPNGQSTEEVENLKLKDYKKMQAKDFNIFTTNKKQKQWQKDYKNKMQQIKQKQEKTL